MSQISGSFVAAWNVMDWIFDQYCQIPSDMLPIAMV